MSEDIELLRQYAETGSDEAFKTLVIRHAGMVHGAALRMVRSESLAQDVTQAVFILLARKGSSLRSGTVVAGWLYRTTRFVALEAIRGEQRRLRREQDAITMNEASASTWDQISPRLEEAMAGLGSADRDALVLRFLEERSFAEVGTALGMSEAAAKMRVGRAIEKLRCILGRKDLVLSGAALLGVLRTHAGAALPPELADTAANLALAAAKAGSSYIPSHLVNQTMRMITWNKIKSVAVATVLALLLLTTALIGVREFSSTRTGPERTHKPATFGPMAGDWQGTLTLQTEENATPVLQDCALTVRTLQNGRGCDIEMRLRSSPDQPVDVQHYAHTLTERGDEMFTVSDPRTGRGDGNGVVTENLEDPRSGIWRMAVHFPFPGSRGVMDCSWERHGEDLVIKSHDEYFHPRGSDHVYATLQLKRVVSASRL